jgi:hypothetical protein
VNHPKQNGPAWEYGGELSLDSFEVWQGPWPHRNSESLAQWDALLASGRRITGVGGSDYHCPAGDAERGWLRLGQPTTWVQVHERSVAGLLAGIRAGRVTISAAPGGPRLVISARSGAAHADMGQALPAAELPATLHVEALVWRGQGLLLQLVADGEVVFAEPVLAEHVAISASVRAFRYVRAELVGDCPPERLPQGAPAVDLRSWRWALSNPIYVDAPEAAAQGSAQ